MTDNRFHKGIMRYEGCNFFRQRLVLATLSGKSIKINKIRHKDDNPGLREFEASFIRLLDTITNGSIIEVNETGTTLTYQPGMLSGGKFDHECNPQRSIGYYLEGLISLAPFCKKPINAVLKGVTNSQTDPSVDCIKLGALPVLKRFLGFDEGLELKIVSRGVPPGGGGQVCFSCPVRKQLRPILLTDPGKIKRIRGVAFAVRVSPVTSNRIVEAAKGVLLKFIPDIYIYTDHYKGFKAGRSPGFGICLVAETTNGVFYTAEAMSRPSNSNETPSVPEDIGQQGAHLLLEEIYRGGCIDSTSQSMSCLFMALGQRDVSKLLSGPLSPYTIQFLRHLHNFFQIMFKLEISKSPEEEELNTGSEKVLLTCLGIGFTNLNKTTS